MEPIGLASRLVLPQPPLTKLSKQKIPGKFTLKPPPLFPFLAQMVKTLLLLSSLLLSISSLAAENGKTAKAILQLHPSGAVDPLLLGEINRNFSEEELKEARNPKHLTEALKSLDLKLPEKELENLKRSLSISFIRGTDFLQMTLKDHPKRISIINALAKTYHKNRNLTEMRLAHKSWTALDQRLKEKESVVEKRKNALAALRKQLPPPALETPPNPTPDQQLYQNTYNRLLESKVDLDRLRTAQQESRASLGLRTDFISIVKLAE